MNTQFFQGLRDFLPRRRLAQGWCLRLAAAACLTIFAMPSVLADPSTYRFGVVPQQAASRLVQMWAPLLHDVSAQTGVRLEFHTAPNIPEFERRLAAGEYDFAYMNPYHFVVFNRAPGYRALAHERDKRIQGIVVIHHESSLNDLSQLQGLKVCFPSPAAFAASLLPRAEMERRGITIEAVFVGSHDSSYRNVAKQLCAAGGGIQRTLRAVAPEVREQVKILWGSPLYTPHAIAVHPRVDATLAQRIQVALVDLAQHAPETLETAALGALVAADDAAWDDVRMLNEDRLQRLANMPVVP
jgi:phosphonate transport system substrate-binding protein